MKNGNGWSLPVIAFVVGLALGAMGTWINASDKFVNKEQYRIDIQRIERKIDLLLEKEK